MNNAYTIISDPGIDDLVALVLLYKLTPVSKNCLISTFGNATEEITAKNAKEFIAFIAQEWIFVNGSKLPLNGVVKRPWPDYFHGPDGVWGVHPQINTNVIQSLKKYPSNSHVISLAPMRDTLKVLKKRGVKNFTVMGGAFRIEGNETKYAETNIAFDPDSAAEFFKTCNKKQVRVVPLDVTRKVFWDIETVKNIPENDRINKWLKKLLLAWFEKYNHEREKSFNLHDPLAVYLTFFPNEAVWRSSGLKVITKGEKRGKITFDKKNWPCEVALDLINEKEISQKIYKLVFGVD